MPDERPLLTLAHSPDADDAFMWWPIAGRSGGPPVLDTGRFRFRAVVADIEVLNRRAATAGDLDITALSARAYADVADRYALTACGGSFGEGYGPKVVCHADSTLRCEGCLRSQRPVIAIPGRRTTAFLVLSLVLGGPFDFVEMPFERIIDAVSRGGHEGTPIGAGLVIHESQLTFGAVGLRQVVDLGEWWTARHDGPLPLGVNAVRRDLEARFGPGTLAELGAVLRRSVEHARSHREESLDYAMGFALAHADLEEPRADARARVARYVDLYVNERTVDMGPSGRASIERLLAEGARAGLCPRVERVAFAGEPIERR